MVICANMAMPLPANGNTTSQKARILCSFYQQPILPIIPFPTASRSTYKRKTWSNIKLSVFPVLRSTFSCRSAIFPPSGFSLASFPFVGLRCSFCLIFSAGLMSFKRQTTVIFNSFTTVQPWASPRPPHPFSFLCLWGFPQLPSGASCKIKLSFPEGCGPHDASLYQHSLLSLIPYRDVITSWEFFIAKHIIFHKWSFHVR